VPHAEIFPHCSLIVHHGGAGTTQAALLAGKPLIVVAHGFDQTYWANQIFERKLGGKPLLRDSVTPMELSKEIRVVLQSEEIQQNATLIGKTMASEKGVENAIVEIEKVMKR